MEAAILALTEKNNIEFDANVLDFIASKKEALQAINDAKGEAYAPNNNQGACAAIAHFMATIPNRDKGHFLMKFRKPIQ